MPDLRSAVRRCPLASTAVGGDCYSVGYSAPRSCSDDLSVGGEDILHLVSLQGGDGKQSGPLLYSVAVPVRRPSRWPNLRCFPSHAHPRGERPAAHPPSSPAKWPARQAHAHAWIRDLWPSRGPRRGGRPEMKTTQSAPGRGPAPGARTRLGRMPWTAFRRLALTRLSL
jgi:hypothetical protein